MAKPFYADYINHCLRFYVRNENFNIVCLANDIDKQKWVAVDRVLRKLPEEDRSIIMEVYSGEAPLLDNVKRTSKNFEISETTVWTLISKVTKQIAKERRMI